MEPKNYGAQSTTLDAHLDSNLNSPDVLTGARNIPVFHWPAVKIPADQSAGYGQSTLEIAAILIVDNPAKIRLATAELLSHLGHNEGYFGLKLGEDYLPAEQILDGLVQKLQTGDTVAWSAEHNDYKKCLSVILSRNMGDLMYNGESVRAPEGKGFARVFSRDHQDRSIKKVLTLPEVMYLQAISSD